MSSQKIEFANCKSCKEEYITSNSKYGGFCSRECFQSANKSNLKLKSLKPIKKKCKICKSAFIPKNVSTEVVCENYDCKVSYALQIVEKQRKTKKIQDKKIATEQKKKMTVDLMSDDKYRSTVLQPVINEIARLIDFGQPCIATENYGKENGGHYISVGANRTICLNLHNIHIQSFESNHWKSGDTLKYQGGIIRVYGEEYLGFMDGLGKHPPIQLRKKEMIVIYENACKIRLKLRKNEKLRSPKERIELRNQINLELGIYQEEYCVF
jgi:hypothetical protein